MTACSHSWQFACIQSLQPVAIHDVRLHPIMTACIQYPATRSFTTFTHLYNDARNTPSTNASTGFNGRLLSDARITPSTNASTGFNGRLSSDARITPSTNASTGLNRRLYYFIHNCFLCKTCCDTPWLHSTWNIFNTYAMLYFLMGNVTFALVYFETLFLRDSCTWWSLSLCRIVLLLNYLKCLQF